MCLFGDHGSRLAVVAFVARRVLSKHTFLPALITMGMLSWAPRSHADVLVQLGVVIDKSSSTQGEIATFRAGIIAGLGNLPLDGTVELTLVDFEGLFSLSGPDPLRQGNVIYGPQVMASAADLAGAESAVNAITSGEGTNIEDGLQEARLAMTASPNFGDNTVAIVNLLSDGRPTMYNACCGLGDIDSAARRANAQAAALAERDAGVAAGIDVYSAEALGSSAEDLAFLEDLVAPQPFATVTGPDFEFPNPFTSAGWVIPLAGVEDIEAALAAKIVAVDEIPEPATAWLLGLGLACLMRRRRAGRNQRASS